MDFLQQSVEALATQDHPHGTRSKRNKMGRPQSYLTVAGRSVSTADTNNKNLLKTVRADALEKETAGEPDDYGQHQAKKLGADQTKDGARDNSPEGTFKDEGMKEGHEEKTRTVARQGDLPSRKGNPPRVLSAARESLTTHSCSVL